MRTTFRHIKSAVLGIAVLAACTACWGDPVGPRVAEAPRTAQHLLADLPRVQPAGTVSDVADTAVTEDRGRVIGEAEVGSEHLVAYTTASGCGLLVVAAGGQDRVRLQLTASRPSPPDTSPSAAAGSPPGGPYGSASSRASGPGERFAELFCSDRSWVATYDSPAAQHSRTEAGPSLVLSPAPGSNRPFVMAVGSAELRQQAGDYFRSR
ncbi:MAG: hypothetical protein FWE15_21640 [Actinomycetia bacterium]|nr:hypothetical protein [Actinomycetes bacterium]MCL2732613.1 hypothetical protein [Actinomycetes bacterium]